MSNDPKNPISNETGEYLQELAESQRAVVDSIAKMLDVPVEAPESDAKPTKKSRRK